MLALATYGTKNYLYAIEPMVQAAISAASHHRTGVFIFSSDESTEATDAASLIKSSIPSGWSFRNLIVKEIADDTSENYKIPAQLRIAKLQGEALQCARQIGCSKFWSVESDVIVPPDALKMSEWVLDIPDGHYDVAMVTYPNTSFLGGRGSPSHPIAQDYTDEERDIGEELQKEIDEIKKEEKEFQESSKKPPEKWVKRAKEVREKINKCSPKGNIWHLNDKFGWRPRGWLHNAYPAIGRGAVLPTDWVGMGCTLLSKRALDTANFVGYTGEGTQDLFLCWHKWFPLDIKMSVITHVVADHIKPEIDEEGKKTGKYTHYRAYHQPIGQDRGHLRVQPISFEIKKTI